MVTCSLLHPKYEPLEPKIAPSATTVTASSPSVANRGARQTRAGLVFGAQNGQHCNLTLSTHRHGEFIAYVVVNTRSRYVARWADLVIGGRFRSPNHEYIVFPLQSGVTVEVPLASLSLIALQSRLCIHASMHPCIHASMHPCIHASMHPCTQSCMHRHMYTAAWFALCYGWRVGIV